MRRREGNTNRERASENRVGERKRERKKEKKKKKKKGEKESEEGRKRRGAAPGQRAST